MREQLSGVKRKDGSIRVPTISSVVDFAQKRFLIELSKFQNSPPTGVSGSALACDTLTWDCVLSQPHLDSAVNQKATQLNREVQ